MSHPAQAEMSRLRIAIAEDSAILREGLIGLLERRGYSVVIRVGAGDALIREVQAILAAGEPLDVVIADVRMPPTHTDEGLQAVLELRRVLPGLPVLVFSQYLEPRIAARLLADDDGAIGYLLKDRVADVGDFLDALHRVARGETVLDPAVIRRLIRSTSTHLPATGALTGRERDVLTLMAEGRSNSAIAASLHVSYGAVEKYVAGIFTKLHLGPDTSSHRRVLAVLHYLDTGPTTTR